MLRGQCTFVSRMPSFFFSPCSIKSSRPGIPSNAPNCTCAQYNKYPSSWKRGAVYAALQHDMFRLLQACAVGWCTSHALPTDMLCAMPHAPSKHSQQRSPMIKRPRSMLCSSVPHIMQQQHVATALNNCWRATEMRKGGATGLESLVLTLR